MRKINDIIIHCTATKEGRGFTVANIDRWHKARGWRCIGYHFVIYRDGTVHPSRPIEQIGAHTSNHNARSIGVCYVGGLDASGKPKDTRTPQQRTALHRLVSDLRKRFPGAALYGHRDYAPKACPSFDVHRGLWFDGGNLGLT